MRVIIPFAPPAKPKSLLTLTRPSTSSRAARIGSLTAARSSKRSAVTTRSIPPKAPPNIDPALETVTLSAPATSSAIARISLVEASRSAPSSMAMLMLASVGLTVLPPNMPVIPPPPPPTIVW